MFKQIPQSTSIITNEFQIKSSRTTKASQMFQGLPDDVSGKEKRVGGRRGEKRDSFPPLH